MILSPPPIRTAINDKTAPFNSVWSKWLTDLRDAVSNYAETINEITADYTITTSDLGKVIVFNSPIIINVAVPKATKTGYSYKLANVGVGRVNLSSADSLFNGSPSQFLDQYDIVIICDYAVGKWVGGL